MCKWCPLNELPFCKYPYTLGQNILDYTSCERDLGILINERLDWHEHHNYLLKKSYQMLGMTKRTCHFVFDRGKKRMCFLELKKHSFRPKKFFRLFRPKKIFRSTQNLKETPFQPSD